MIFNYDFKLYLRIGWYLIGIVLNPLKSDGHYVIYGLLKRLIQARVTIAKEILT